MVRSVDRAIDVLVLVSQSSQPVALPQITRELDLPRTTAFSLVRTLTKRQMLRFVEGQGYRLGPLVGTLAQSAGVSKTLIGLVHPALERISRETAETAFLAVPSGDRIVFVDKIESPHAIRYSAQIGTQRELYCTAHGKLVLACMTDEELAAYFARTTMQAHSSTTLTDEADLRKEIDRIRKQGYSVSNGEYSAEAFGLSTPIFRGVGGPLLGMISAVGPLPRMKPRRAEVAKLLLSIAGSLSAECSGVEAPAGAAAAG